EDLDAAALFAATRLPGAPDPVIPQTAGHADEFETEEPSSVSTLTTGTPAQDESACRRLLEKAAGVSASGNVVRAAILRMKAASLTVPDGATDIRASAREELDRLSVRLQTALQLNEAKTEEWRHALPLLLERAARGVWSIEARLLYDLQKACVDRER